MNGQAELLEIIGALGTAGRFTGGLDGREQKRDQYGNDRNDNQEFDEREGTTTSH
jgi:hypothetical protein